MTSGGFRECVKVALHAKGWKTNWAEDRSGSNEAGWRCHYDDKFRESRVLRIDLAQTGTLHIAGDERGAFVFADTTLRLAAKVQGWPMEDGVLLMPIGEAKTFFVMLLQFKVAEADSAG